MPIWRTVRDPPSLLPLPSLKYNPNGVALPNRSSKHCKRFGAMDLLKRELQKKRQALQEEGFAGKKFFKRSELEQKRIQKLRQEEILELQTKSLKNPNPNSASPSSQTPNPNPGSASSKPSSSSSTSTSKALESLSEEQKIDALDFPRAEVIRRLRFLKQPITLFGEDDAARLERLKLHLKAGIFDVDSDMTEGQTNDFLRDISELRKRQKTGLLHDRKRKMESADAGEDADGGGGGAGDDDLSEDGGSSGADADNDLKRMKTNFEELCDEDKILVFFKRLLYEWKQELEEMQEAEKRTAKGKSMVATFKQCARYLNPLFKFCRKKMFVVSYVDLTRTGSKCSI
ncbi:hypothetical protein ACLOJK_028801 [Asimina triloba]